MLYFELLDWKIISHKQGPLSSLGSEDLRVFMLHESLFQRGSLFFRVKCELTHFHLNNSGCDWKWMIQLTPADDALFSNRLFRRMIMVVVLEFFVHSSLWNAHFDVDHNLSVYPSIHLCSVRNFYKKKNLHWKKV